MRHAKRTFKVGRTSSHKRCMIANMLKSMVMKGRIKTTLAKAKELRRHADKLVTLAKEDTVQSRRLAKARLMLCFNPLSSKEARKAKGGDLSVYNDDRKVLGKLFGEIKDRFKERNGGYTRIIKETYRVGDRAPTCFIEFLS